MSVISLRLRFCRLSYIAKPPLLTHTNVWIALNYVRFPDEHWSMFQEQYRFSVRAAESFCFRYSVVDFEHWSAAVYAAAMLSKL